MTNEEKAQVIVNATDKAGDLNFIQFRIMLELYLIQDEPVGEIANRLKAKPSQISQNLDVLEASKLIKRRNDSVDRRRVFVSLTKNGEKNVNSFFE